jgi:hypothetical protein
MMRAATIRPWSGAVGALLLAMGAHVVAAQSAVGAPHSLTPRLQAVAGSYPVHDVEFFGRDSVRIDVEDSSRTVSAVRAHAWMFGPPVTAAEAAGCPPQKVLGRRIARELWRSQVHTIALELVIVRVHGTSGLDRLSYEDMYYRPADLDAPWAGDQLRTPQSVR